MGLHGDNLIGHAQTNRTKPLRRHYLGVIAAGVLQLLRGQLMRLPEEQQLLVQEAHLLLGAFAVAQLKDTRDMTTKGQREAIRQQG